MVIRFTKVETQKVTLRWTNELPQRFVLKSPRGQCLPCLNKQFEFVYFKSFLQIYQSGFLFMLRNLTMSVTWTCKPQFIIRFQTSYCGPISLQISANTLIDQIDGDTRNKTLSMSYTNETAITKDSRGYISFDGTRQHLSITPASEEFRKLFSL